MEPSLPPLSPQDAWSEHFARALDDGRFRALELVDEQQRRIDGLEAELTAELQQLLAASDPERESAQRRDAELRDAELTRREAALADERRELSQARQRLDGDRSALADERAELAARRDASVLQRRRIARKLKTEWAAQREIIRRRKNELAQLAGAEHDQLQFALAAARARLEDLSQQRARLALRLRKRAAEARELRRANRRLLDQTGRNGGASAPGRTEGSLGRGVEPRPAEDRETLERQLMIAQRQLAESDSVSEAQERKFEDLQRRFEMAVSELRVHKQRSQELEDRFGSAETGRPEAAQDWESRKRQLLDALEHDRLDPDDFETRATIQGTIRITDEVVAKKDREIAELKMLLDQQSQNIGSLAVGASAVADILNSDELVRQERERLAQLQTEWRDKLRQAEIEISVERAQLARARNELDDQLSELNKAQPVSPPRPEVTPALTKLGSGRWRAFLGIRDKDPGGP